jgi:hypothetical protein
MGTSGIEASSSEYEGVTPRILRDIFQIKESYENSDRSISLKISFIEIYNEECKDLLHPEIESKEILIREDSYGRIFFLGAREVTVKSVSETLSVLEKGCLNRITGRTKVNEVSSRSHAVFTISMSIIDFRDIDAIEAEGIQVKSRSGSRESSRAGKERGREASTSKAEKRSEAACIQSKLHLVDLAGSERAKRTGERSL